MTWSRLVVLLALVAVVVITGVAVWTVTDRRIPPTLPPDACPAAAGHRIEVTDGPGLARALRAALPGDVVHLAPGIYSGRFESSVSGTAVAPIEVCGSRQARLDGGGIDTGYGFHITVDYWNLRGFSITGSQKGVVLDHASHAMLRDLAIYGIGDEGVHFRDCSSDNLLADSDIHDVGQADAHSGEGVYVGSAVRNWKTCSGGKPDRSDRNRVINNRIGPNTTAESIDIKEGTSDTIVSGNTFDGRGMTAADSWVDAKGNGALITDNTGSHAPRDGFQSHLIVAGWGHRNRFTANHAQVDGSGYGFRLQGSDNIVTCDNVVTGAASGMTNVPCS
ncbi:MAG: right-handed parallel beta-helix repeat-containing protein [Chloroflexota bacterium]|nr:right-handed parallel beta-helix repeat-containing protein [Chloroflexota bacterium]